jgi:hypothetical protein
MKLTTRRWLAYSFTVGFLLAAAGVFAWPFPQQNEQLLAYMLGQLSGFCAMIVAAYFGKDAEAPAIDREQRALINELQERARGSEQFGDPRL